MSFWQKYILYPLGLSCPVKLRANAASVKIHANVTLLDVLRQCPSISGAWYTIPFYICTGFLQLMFAAFADFSKSDKVVYERHYLRVPDGGTLSIDFTPPLSELQEDTLPIMICIHGLTGGSHESYVRSILKEATSTGKWRGCVLNYRGCGYPAVVTSSKFYHGGYTDDLRMLLLYLSHMFPKAPLYAFGCSLGANVLTKYCGEEGSRTPLKGAVVLSNPWNFWEGHLVLESTCARRAISRAMAKNLRDLFGKYEDTFKTDSRIYWNCVYSNPNQTLYCFDSQVTSRLGGFKSVEEYYLTQSSDQYIPDVRIPLLAFHAMDDPVTASSCIPFDAIANNPHCAIATTRAGSHLGWFEPAAVFTKQRWIRKPVTEFFDALHTTDPSFKENPSSPHRHKAPEIGDEMVLAVGRPDLGFRLIAAKEIEGGFIPDADPASGPQGF